MKVLDLDNGFVPERPVILESEKKQLFIAFLKCKRIMRSLYHYCESVNAEIKYTAEVSETSKLEGNFTTYRHCKRQLEKAEQLKKDCIKSMYEISDVALDLSAGIDKCASFGEKTALLGISETRAFNLMKDVEPDRDKISFTLLVTELDDSHYDSSLGSFVMMSLIKRIRSHPILDRQASQILNETLGQRLFPLCDVQKPKLVT